MNYLKLPQVTATSSYLKICRSHEFLRKVALDLVFDQLNGRLYALRLAGEGGNTLLWIVTVWVGDANVRAAPLSDVVDNSPILANHTASAYCRDANFLYIEGSRGSWGGDGGCILHTLRWRVMWMCV